MAAVVSRPAIAAHPSRAVRPPDYRAHVGGFGLLAFIYTVGLDLDSDTRSGSLLGWPLVLLIVAVALLAASATPVWGRSRE